MSLKEEFLDKMQRFGLSLDWFQHPADLLKKAEDEIDASFATDTQIDSITTIAGIKALLKQQNAAQRTLQKRILRYEAAALWMLIQATFEGR